MALSLTAGACAGAGADQNGVASLGSGERSAGEDSGAKRGGDEDFEDAALEFAVCMREHGIDMPVPEEGGVFHVDPGTGPGDLNPEKFREAERECRHLLPDLGRPPSAEERAKMNDAMLAFVRCMRDEGIDMPDPQDGGLILDRRQGGAGFDPEDPEFQAAHRRCERFLPGRPRPEGGAS